MHGQRGSTILGVEAIPPGSTDFSIHFSPPQGWYYVTVKIWLILIEKILHLKNNKYTQYKDSRANGQSLYIQKRSYADV
jgi:hypothetical protein